MVHLNVTSARFWHIIDSRWFSRATLMQYKVTYIVYITVTSLH